MFVYFRCLRLLLHSDCLVSLLKSPSVTGAAASHLPFGSSSGWEGLLIFLKAVLSLATLLTLAALSSPHLYFQTWNSLFSALFLTSPGFPCSLQSASCRSQRTLACTMASPWCLHTQVAPCTLCGRSDSPPSASSTPCARVPLASPTTRHHLVFVCLLCRVLLVVPHSVPLALPLVVISPLQVATAFPGSGRSLLLGTRNSGSLPTQR